jgi:hypothetical protein
MTMTEEEQCLMDRLGAIHRRINEIADLEARSAYVKGWAAQGNLMPEKERLIAQTEKILDELLGGQNA